MRKFVLEVKDFEEFADLGIGFCTSCGVEHDGIEPDAEECDCDSCGFSQVYGVESLLLKGALTVMEETKNG